MSIGARIKEQRTKQALTQPELAHRLDMSLDSIKKLETNRVNPSIETLTKLSDLFGCSTDYLLGKDSFAAPEVARLIREIAEKFEIDLHDPEKSEQLRQIIIKVFEQTKKGLK